MKREILENGAILRALVKQFNNERSRDNYITVLSCLRDSFVWIPCNVEMSDADMEKFLKAKKNDVLTTEADVRLIPDTLQSGDALFLPVFSNCEQMGEEYGGYFSKIEKHFFEAMSIAMARENVTGIVLDAFSQPFVVEKDLFDFIGNIPTNIEDDVNM